MYVSFQSFKSFYSCLTFDPHKKPGRKDGVILLPPCCKREKLRPKRLSDFLKAHTVPLAWGGAESSGTCPWDSSGSVAHMGSPRLGASIAKLRKFGFSRHHAKHRKVTKSQQHESGFLGQACHREPASGCARVQGEGSPPDFHRSTLKSFWINYKSYCKGQVLNDLTLKFHVFLKEHSLWLLMSYLTWSRLMPVCLFGWFWFFIVVQLELSQLSPIGLPCPPHSPPTPTVNPHPVSTSTDLLTCSLTRPFPFFVF